MFLLQVPVVARLMERCGIVCRWRAGMTLDLQRLSEHPSLPAEYELREWDSALLPEVARLDFHAYRGTLDGLLYWQYVSAPAGCERMWREAQSGRFGRFDSQRTLLLFRD